jgi:hypothetical protein
MKLQHITFTGIDGKTDLGELWEIQQEYPIVEFGVLVAKNWRENGNRYFNPSFLDALESRGLNLSAHLCGSVARAAIRGDWELYRDWARSYPYFFNRCQINISLSKENPEKITIDDCAHSFNEIILQQKDIRHLNLFHNSQKKNYGEPDISVLLDASGGQGINTEIEVLSGNYKVGYAGGINPDNVYEKLKYLLTNEQVGDFWIDMESGVRTDDWFDTAKVRQVLKEYDRVLNDIGI